MKIFIAGGYAPSYQSMFRNRGFEVVLSIDEADMVQFTGGEDVTPRWYDEFAHPASMFNESRDRMERVTFRRAIDLGIPMAGICRGGQFLNVLNGGKLFQDVDGHLGTHEAEVFDGRKIKVSSTHHQMMRPDVDGKVLMFANNSTRREYMFDKMIATNLEPKHDDVEAVYYEDTNCLCFQPHPEIMDKDSDCQNLYFEFIDTYLGVKNAVR